MQPLPLPQSLINHSTHRFIPLGKPNLMFTPGGNLTEAVKYRIDGITDGPVNGFWGTLGRADGQVPDWEGELYCSGNGNESPSGDLERIVAGLRGMYPGDEVLKQQTIIERVIAFDDVEFGPSASSRQLRLTLMLSPMQGAVVFYHHGEPGSTSQEGGTIEYILPAEGNTWSDKPGRRTFYFEVPRFSAAHNEIDEGNAAAESRFVVKALVFTHDSVPPLELLRKFEGYGFKQYDHTHETGFREIGAEQIDLTRRTLLLVHGTFASIRASFRGLTQRQVNDVPWFKHLLDNGHYEQIIGFDHSTVLDSSFTNVDVFKQRIRVAHGNDWKFTHPVDIIGTSRGGIVVKTMCNDAELNSAGGKMKARKVALVSCANGAGLLDEETGVPGIRLLLSLLSRLPGPSPAIFGALQLAYDVYRRMPGTLSQTPGSELLQRVLDGRPSYHETRYYAVCGNWEKRGVGIGRILDALLDLILRDANDGVNYTSRMVYMPEGLSAYGHPLEYYLHHTRVANAFHTGYFTTDGETRPETILHGYLTDDTGLWMTDLTPGIT